MFCAFGPKMKNNLQFFKKILRFFDQNLYGKLTFFTFVTKYFLDFWFISESIYLLKIRSDFYNNFPISRGGGRSGGPPLPTLLDAVTSPCRNRKNCCRNLVFSSRGIILSERKQNSKKYLVWNCEKSPFWKEILIKKSQKIEFFFPFGPNAQILQAGCLFLPVKWKSFLKSWWACNVLHIPVDFLQKFQEFSFNF